MTTTATEPTTTIAVTAACHSSPAQQHEKDPREMQNSAATDGMAGAFFSLRLWGCNDESLCSKAALPGHNTLSGLNFEALMTTTATEPTTTMAVAAAASSSTTFTTTTAAGLRGNAFLCSSTGYITPVW